MDWSYISGFFDGEGNINLIKVKTSLNGTNQLSVMIRIYQQDAEVLKSIQSFLGFGKIYSKRDLHELTFNKKSNVKFFLENIKDKVIVKKAQVDYLLKNYSFERKSNAYFDVDQFRSSIKRKNVDKFRKLHTTFLTNRLTE